jgi:hypothetical protein
MSDKTITVFQCKYDEKGICTDILEEDIPIDSILDLNLRLSTIYSSTTIYSNSRNLGLRPLYLDAQNREFYLSGKQFSKFIFEGLPVNRLNGKFKIITRDYWFDYWFIELIQQ